jgi:DNA polymerase-1
MPRLYNGVRLLGSGPCLSNVEKIDAGAMPMINCMAATGLQVDLSHFARMDTELTRDMERITEEAKVLTGHYCNLDSSDQKSELLFKKLGLKQARVKMTASGDRESVEDQVLLAIQHDHPIVPMMLEYAELSKLRGTYVRPMPKLAVRVKFGKWRMYPHFNTTRVPSGRLSCKDPNLLAMPNRTERGRDIRKGFITDEGWKLLSVDESQIEVRIAAHCSKDPNLIKVYQNREDIYSDFATAAFRLKDKRYQDDNGKWIYPTVDRNNHRFPAKTCVLASIYAVTDIGLLEQMPVICSTCNLPATKHICSKFKALWHEGNCQDLINAFYIRYPGVMRDRKLNHARTMKHGYAWDIWGRILHCQAVRSVLDWVVAAGLREIGNFPYQSGAQGTIKLTMAAVQDDLEQGSLLEVVHPLLQVHDELLFEVRDDLVDDLSALVEHRFRTCAPLEVEIEASSASAYNWGSLEK